jgi:hypothetical protein
MLISCLNCGHIYSVSVATIVYVGPDLQNKLKSIECLECGSNLCKTFSPYPERYFTESGVLRFERPSVIPPDSESFVKEFDEIY